MVEIEKYTSWVGRTVRDLRRHICTSKSDLETCGMPKSTISDRIRRNHSNIVGGQWPLTTVEENRLVSVASANILHTYN